MHETAQRIMTAAVDLFWERGFKQTTVRDITSACGLTQGALYIYFSSKDVLLADIVKYAFAILESHTVQTIDEQASSTSSETLCALVDSYVWYVVEHRKLAKVANLYWHELAPRERSTARAVRDGVTERFTRVIESGIADKSFTPLSAGETRLLPIGLLTMLNGIMDWHRPGGRLDRNAISLYFQEIALRLVGADIDTPPSRDLTS